MVTHILVASKLEYCNVINSVVLEEYPEASTGMKCSDMGT